MKVTHKDNSILERPENTFTVQKIHGLKEIRDSSVHLNNINAHFREAIKQVTKAINKNRDSLYSSINQELLINFCLWLGESVLGTFPNYKVLVKLNDEISFIANDILMFQWEKDAPIGLEFLRGKKEWNGFVPNAMKARLNSIADNLRLNQNYFFELLIMSTLMNAPVGFISQKYVDEFFEGILKFDAWIDRRIETGNFLISQYEKRKGEEKQRVSRKYTFEDVKRTIEGCNVSPIEG